MKNCTLYILLVAIILSTTTVMAQHKEYKGNMSAMPMQLEQIGDSLHIHIYFDFRNVHVKSRRSISLIPTLVSSNNSINFAEVMVKGRANYLISRRENALMSKSERRLYDQKQPYTVVKGYKSDESKLVHYRKAIPFETWMKEAQLDIREDLCGCGSTPRSLATSRLASVKLEPVIIPYEIMPHLTYVQPEVEAIKKREMVGEAFLDFVVGKIDIRTDYMNNPRELKKITDMMENIRTDKAVKVKGISVEGYASPEGTLKFNQYLSEGRAKALVNYLIPRFDYPKNMYSVKFGGENWDGLLAMVESSDMKYRDEVLHIIKTIPAEIDYKKNTSRKKSLMNLRIGEPYRYMLKNYYPSLRKAVCKIDYEVKGFDVIEAKEVFKTRPQNLSLNEMFLVANTYEIGSKEFINIFETAVRLFPQDETANLNAAVVALIRRDTVSAERHLKNIRSRVRVAEYDNAMGVLLMLQGDYIAAEQYLMSAAATGLTSAKENLKELQLKLTNIKEINKTK